MARFDIHDPLNYVFDWFDWSGRQLKRWSDQWIEQQGNARMVGPDEARSSALQQTYPFAGGLRGGRSDPYLRDPETYAATTILAANLWARTMADDEFVRVDGGLTDESAVFTQERLIKYHFHRPGNQNVLWKGFLDVATFGLGWVHNPVKMQGRMTLGPSKRNIGEGLVLPDFNPQYNERLTPIWENLSVYDVHPDWSANLGEEMRGGGFVGKMSASEFEHFILNEPGADKDALNRVLNNNKVEYHFTKATRGEKWREIALRQLTEADMTLPEAWRPIQYFIYRGEVPWKAIDDIERYRTIIVANDQVVLDAPHPYYKHPFKCLHILPMNDRPFGMPPAEVARFEQDMLDTWRMLEIKAGLRTVQTPIIADPSAFDDVAQLDDPASDMTIHTRPGVDINRVVGQMDFNYSTIFTARGLIDAERQTIREATGISGLIRGLAAGSRTTAREIGEISAAGNLPLDVRVDLIESEDLPSLARDISQRYILALRDEDNPDAALAELLGLPAGEGEEQIVKLTHLAEDSSIIFQGSQRFNARAGQGGVVERVLTILASMPGLSNMVNMPQLIADMLKSVSPDAPMRYLLDPNSAIGQSMFNQALAGGQGGAGVPSAPKPQPADTAGQVA